MSADRRYGNDSRTLFLIIRGVLWGALAGALAIVMVEILGIIASGFDWFGLFIVVGGPAALVLGALVGLVIALAARAVTRRIPDAEERKRKLTGFVGAASFVVSVAGLVIAAVWFMNANEAVVQWWLMIALIVLGVGVPVAGLAVYAAGKVNETMEHRFSDK